MIDSFLLIGLPYAALFLCVIGTILRVNYYGYSVTSHSSQFLESKKLFWGSRLFHSGIVVLLIGHIVGFLIPKTIIFLTATPLWLLVIEITAFAFGILSFVGILLLIIRRVQVKRLHSVTSKMDLVVYTVIAFQILTGLTIAYFHRWGTAWYASALVPYLRSIFIFSPDTAVITTMPLMIKLHVISAFVFIGLIPFSRLIHFVAYPVRYLWRNVQLVIWNRDLKASRASREKRMGIKPKNN
ncbi:MAG: respiratory nitrate reductase subunit gamma [Bacteroidales bacterium]|nr:respiratory nitrate reductase subunit gamma [Bacteroidales bacterium]